LLQPRKIGIFDRLKEISDFKEFCFFNGDSPNFLISVSPLKAGPGIPADANNQILFYCSERKTGVLDDSSKTEKKEDGH